MALFDEQAGEPAVGVHHTGEPDVDEDYPATEAKCNGRAGVAVADDNALRTVRAQDAVDERRHFGFAAFGEAGVEQRAFGVGDDPSVKATRARQFAANLLVDAIDRPAEVLGTDAGVYKEGVVDFDDRVVAGYPAAVDTGGVECGAALTLPRGGGGAVSAGLPIRLL